jgi:hypothetical protein
LQLFEKQNPVPRLKAEGRVERRASRAQSAISNQQSGAKPLGSGAKGAWVRGLIIRGEGQTKALGSDAEKSAKRSP